MTHYAFLLVSLCNDNAEMLCENAFTESLNGIIQPQTKQMKSALKFLKNYSSASNAAAREVAGDDCDDGTSETIPALSVIDDLSFIEVETNGFDPYNSGSFDSKKLRRSK